MEKTNLLLRNARVLDPGNMKEAVADLLIQDGVVRRIGRNLKAEDIETWELRGKCVAPGFIDLHCHLREPGREDEETIASGTLAALAGGFTTVCCMPNTDPPIDHENVVRSIIYESERVGQARVLPIAAATRARAGVELAEIGTMVRTGAVAISDDGEPIASPEVMRRALEYAKVFDIPVISHCEEKALSGNGVMHEGAVSARLGLPGVPACAEEVMVLRDILLAEYTGGRLHIAHVSTQGSVEIIRWAKARGFRFTCETCPHYFTLTDDNVASFDTNYKVNPPLRSGADREAIRQGLGDGTIDVIATDHAPHLESEKAVEFEHAPSGMIGLETAFALGIEELVNAGYLSLLEYLAKLSAAPARILNLPARIAVGEPANLVVFDPKQKWIYRREGVLSRAHNSPFFGRELTGRVLATIVGTRVFQF